MNQTQYTVQSGDTLSKIAANNGVSINDITGYKSGDPNKIGVGEVLNINKAAVPSASTAPATGLTQGTMTPPPTTTSTAPTGLLGLAKATQDQISALQPTVTQGEKDITDTYTALAGEGQKQTDLYASTGVNDDKQAVDDINNQMTALDKSYNDQMTAITNNNPTGQLSSGQQIQANALTAQHASTMANLALVANVKLGNYNNAKAIVDQQISSETSDLQTKLDGLKFFYQQNSDQLTNDQKTLLQQQTDAVTQDLSDKKDLLTSLGNVQLEAAKNGAPAAVVASIGSADSLSDGITAAGSYLGDKLDDLYKSLQIQQLQQNIASSSAGQDPSEILAYAQQYASNGAIPVGMPKGSFGTVSQVAKQLPKATGTLVDANTGVKSSKLSPTETDAVTATYNLVTNVLPQLKTAFDNTYTGALPALGSMVGIKSSNQQNLQDLTTSFLNQLLVANSGKVVSDKELARYKSLLPGTSSGAFFLFGNNGDQQLADLTKGLTDSLNSKLNTTGTAIYGYSPVTIGGQTYKVGDTISSGNQVGRINSDGTISIISQ